MIWSCSYDPQSGKEVAPFGDCKTTHIDVKYILLFIACKISFVYLAKYVEEWYAETYGELNVFWSYK